MVTAVQVKAARFLIGDFTIQRIFLCGKEGWKNHVVATVPYGSILIQVIMQPVQDAVHTD